MNSLAQKSVHYLQERDQLSRMVAQEANSGQGCKEENFLLREPSLMKEYYSWLESRPYHQSSGQTSNRTQTHLHDSEKQMDTLGGCNPPSCRSEEETIPNLCNLGQHKVYDSGEVDLEGNFMV